ncbi:hypothetical protein BC828DRAFT_388147 [Blastocladiella britannica]|nr:hypothetical protein BC828DRAFT_388147 [Blastocladiella britannica]
MSSNNFFRKLQRQFSSAPRRRGSLPPATSATAAPIAAPIAAGQDDNNDNSDGVTDDEGDQSTSHPYSPGELPPPYSPTAAAETAAARTAERATLDARLLHLLEQLSTGIAVHKAVRSAPGTTKLRTIKLDVLRRQLRWASKRKPRALTTINIDDIVEPRLELSFAFPPASALALLQATNAADDDVDAQCNAKGGGDGDDDRHRRESHRKHARHKSLPLLSPTAATDPLAALAPRFLSLHYLAPHGGEHKILDLVLPSADLRTALVAIVDGLRSHTKSLDGRDYIEYLHNVWIHRAWDATLPSGSDDDDGDLSTNSMSIGIGVMDVDDNEKSDSTLPVAAIAASRDLTARAAVVVVAAAAAAAAAAVTGGGAGTTPGASPRILPTTVSAAVPLISPLSTKPPRRVSLNQTLSALKQFNVALSRDQVRWLFSLYDTSHSGLLDLVAFSRMCMHLKQSPSVVAIFDAITGKTDGRGVLDWPRFLDFLRNTQCVSSADMSDDLARELFHEYAVPVESRVQRHHQHQHQQQPANANVPLRRRPTLGAQQRSAAAYASANTDFITESIRSSMPDEAWVMDVMAFHIYLLSPHNPALVPRERSVWMDMTHPLSHYFVSSSHNTYLTGNQLSSDSSPEGYVRVLMRGGRCVELDCWDGPHDEPIIYHGHTATSKILVRDALAAIKKYAFVASEWPVILSLEMHCGHTQQGKLAAYMKEILGDELVTSWVGGGEDGTPEAALPSPAQLKRRFLVKGKGFSPAEYLDEIQFRSSTTSAPTVSPTSKRASVRRRISQSWAAGTILPSRRPSAEAPQSPPLPTSKPEAIMPMSPTSPRSQRYQLAQQRAANRSAIPLQISSSWTPGSSVVLQEELYRPRSQSAAASVFLGPSGSLPDLLESSIAAMHPPPPLPPPVAHASAALPASLHASTSLSSLPTSASTSASSSLQHHPALLALAVYMRTVKFSGLLAASSVPLSPVLVPTAAVATDIAAASLPNSPSGSPILNASALAPLPSWCSMSSFSESAFMKYARNAHANMLLHLENRLSRIYPGGLRVGSSNYNPIPYWAAGAQMVALNWQTFDSGMMLHTAFFDQNGGSGYVLKPEYMLAPHAPQPVPILFRVDVLCGNHLPKARGKIKGDVINPYVTIEIYDPPVPTRAAQPGPTTTMIPQPPPPPPPSALMTPTPASSTSDTQQQQQEVQAQAQAVRGAYAATGRTKSQVPSVDSIPVAWPMSPAVPAMLLKSSSAMASAGELHDSAEAPILASVPATATTTAAAIAAVGAVPSSMTTSLSNQESPSATFRTKTVYNNGWNPAWNEAYRATISNPDLAMVKLTVYHDAEVSVSSTGEFVGVFCAPIKCLQQGYRHLYLRNWKGKPSTEATLFVKIQLGGATVT